MWSRLVIALALWALAPVLDAAVVSARGPAPNHGQGAFLLAGVLPKNSAEQFELTFWSSIKDSKQIGDYEAYLQAYPKGKFAGLAQARIKQLRAVAPAAPAPAQPQSRPQPAPQPQAQSSSNITQQHPAANTAAKDAPKEVLREAIKEPPRDAVRERSARVKAPVEPDGNKQTPQAPPATPAGPVAAIKDCDACPVMLVLYPGPYTMGNNKSDPTERPAHRVSIKAPFALGKYEVTVGEWNACVEASVCPEVPSLADADDKLPMRDVSWDEAQLYLNWLSKVSGKAYRLPTEAEWEFAARGGSSTRYWWGEQMRGGNASCRNCGQPWDADSPPPVGSFVANPFGFFDMNGSVWEWVTDCWHSSYHGAPKDGSAWALPNCPTRVIRGGSWREDESYMLPTTRFKYDASVRQSQNGFRVARSVK